MRLSRTLPFALLLLLASGLTAALFALAIGYPLLSKLAGDYFALGTLGFGHIEAARQLCGGCNHTVAAKQCLD